MSRQFWNETLAWATGDGASVNSANVETILFPNVVVPANFLQDGRCLRLRVLGKWTTTGSTPTMIFGVRWGGVGGTLLCKTAAITTVASQTAAMWDFDVLIQTRSNGSSGSLMCNGVCRAFAGVAGTIASVTGEGLLTPMTNGGVITPAAVTVDLTTDTALSVTVTPSTTALTLVGLNYTIEALN